MKNGVSICNQFCWEACWPCSAGKPNTGVREAALHPPCSSHAPGKVQMTGKK